MRAAVAAVAMGVLAMPAAAQSTLTFASDAVRAAAQDPRIAAVFAAIERGKHAILAQDVAGLAADHATALLVNTPANRVLTAAQTVGAFKAGLIHYGSSESVIEYAAVRPNGEVLLMGAEHITPLGATRNAGHAETYRVTEVWRPDGDRWLLSLRQATVVEVH